MSDAHRRRTQGPKRWLPAAGPGRTVAVIVLVAVAAGAVGWTIGEQVQSPATAAASHRAPTASPVTARVERRALRAQVITQSSVAYGKAQPVTLTGTVAVGGSAGTPIVTKAPSGGTVKEGNVLLEVSGRPVIALRGTVPMYRTIVPKDTGDDVDQLRRALNRLLDLNLPRTGPFDGPVQAAVKRLYADKGYKPVKVTGGISVASGELLFFDSLPWHLSGVTIAPGAPATGQIATASAPDVYGYGSLGVDDSSLVKKGMNATLTADDGTALAGRVDAVGSGAGAPKSAASTATSNGDDSGGNSGDGEPAGIPVKITFTRQSKARALAGQALKTTIDVGSTSGPVLTVPVSALFTQADGTTRVRVLSSDAPRAAVRVVTVEAGLSVDGNVQVTAAATQLRAGDLVLVSKS